MTRLLFAAASLLVLAACSQGSDAAPPADAPAADEAGGRGDERGRRQDLNGDGRVTRQEARAAQKRMIERVDADGDGTLSAEEVAALPERMARRMQRMDADGDGAVTAAELEQSAEARFRRRDDDGDGVLSGEELERRRGGGGEG